MGSERVDVAIIGGGVVGAAVLERLTRQSRAVWLLERHARPGGEASERNSGVIHAGIYYPPSALKTRLALRGNQLLYEWARQENVPHARLGKLIVATDPGDLEGLQTLLEHGRSVGVPDLRPLTRREISEIDPHIRADAAILSGSTGIVDPAALTASLIAAGRARGAEVLTKAEVRAIEATPGPAYRLDTSRGPVVADAVINVAGLFADEVAAMAGVDRYRIHPCRGDYFLLRTPHRHPHLVYPVKAPAQPGLGIHLTLDTGGRTLIGPDAEYVGSKTDYTPAPQKLEAFLSACKRFLPDVRAEDLSYEQAGLRPKLRPPGAQADRDFVIAEDRPRFVNLVGIDSPGLTASMAIAEEVERLLYA